MPFIADAALDAALAVVADSSTLYICTQEPVTFTEASSTYAAGNKASPSIGAAGDRTPDGRKITIAEITDGTVTDDAATATHWALVKTTGSLLRATGALASGQVVYTANGFTLAAFDVGVPDAA